MDLVRTERGWAGHFICSLKCQWHRNTLIEDRDTGRAIVISSVGQMPDALHPDKYAEIGARRYYETMVFIGKREGEYIEADTTRQIFMDVPWAVKEYPEGTTDLKAEKIHEENVDNVFFRFDELYKTA